MPRHRVGALVVNVAGVSGARLEWLCSSLYQRRMAKVLGVRVDHLIVSDNHVPRTKRPGPVGEIQRAFEAARHLPRSQQRKIVETVDALVEQYKRKEAG